MVVPGLYRSRSLPHYLGCDSGVGSFSEGGGGGGGSGVGAGGTGGVAGGAGIGGGAAGEKGLAGQDKAATEGLVAELRQLITLRQHYYPEGGWGWLVLASSLAVQILSHGLQLGAGVLPIHIQEKFGPKHPTLTGILDIFLIFILCNEYNLLLGRYNNVSFSAPLLIPFSIMGSSFLKCPAQLQ